MGPDSDVTGVAPEVVTGDGVPATADDEDPATDGEAVTEGEPLPGGDPGPDGVPIAVGVTSGAEVAAASGEPPDGAGRDELLDDTGLHPARTTAMAVPASATATAVPRTRRIRIVNPASPSVTSMATLSFRLPTLRMFHAKQVQPV
jgi:hypothetical protein